MGYDWANLYRNTFSYSFSNICRCTVLGDERQLLRLVTLEKPRSVCLIPVKSRLRLTMSRQKITTQFFQVFFFSGFLTDKAAKVFSTKYSMIRHHVASTPYHAFSLSFPLLSSLICVSGIQLATSQTVPFGSDWILGARFPILSSYDYRLPAFLSLNSLSGHSTVPQ